MEIKKILTVILLTTTIFLIACSNNNANTLTGASTTSSDSVSMINDDYIRISLNDVSENLQKYEYDVDGVTVRYFIVEGSDGEIRTAFDACDVCGSKGYTQNDDEIVCNKCGLSFDITGIGTQNKGYGCWPSYLPHEIEGDEIMIKKSDLENGASSFI